MLRSLMLLSVIALIAACGNDQAPPPAKSATSAPPAPSAAPPAAAPTESMPATLGEAMDEDEVVYDPIDVSKLESSWWQQYSSGG